MAVVEFKNEYSVVVDIKRKTITGTIPTYVANDSSILYIKIEQNGQSYDYSTADRYVVNIKRSDGKVIFGEGVYENGMVKYVLGQTEMLVAGIHEVVIQLHLNGTRITTNPFPIKVIGDYENALASEGGYSLLQELFIEVESALDRLNNTTVGELDNKIGVLTNLNTTNKSSLVSAVNETVLQLADIAINVKTFGAVGDGISDDTTSIQNAINSASAIGANVKFEGGKTYITGSLMPKANVLIDLNGSTLRLKNNANLPLIYDYLEPTIRSNFGVTNGILDCNMQNNSDAINQSAGTLWLTNWDNLYFRNIKVINAFRNVFNLFGVKNVVAENIYVKDCGRTNGNGFYSYGFSLEASPQRRNTNIVLRNFICENMYGFGVHARQTDGFDFSNLQFIDLSRLNDSIAITFTDSYHGNANNITVKKSTKTYSVDSHAIEINNCFHVAMDNIEVDSVRTTSILVGDSGTGIVSRFIKLTNIKTSNSGQYSMNINYVDGLIIETSQFDKAYTTGYSNPTKNVLFDNCKFLVSSSTVMTYRRFHYRNTIFTDLYIVEKVNDTCKIIYSFSMTASETKDIGLSIVSGEQCFIGEVDIVSKMSSGFQQGAFAKYLLYAYGSSIQNSSLDTKIIGSFEKLPTITFASNKLTLVNGTGGDLTINVIFTNKNITSLSLT